MPGNEVGDRVHNFFEQGSLSQERHAQLVEGNWPVYNNNLWSGSEKQIAGPLNSSSKNYGALQSDIEREQTNQFSLGSHGLNFMQPNLRPPEYVKNPSQVPQWNLNGYMHSSQIFPSRPNEANFLGVDTEPDRHNMLSRGMSTLETQQQRQNGSQQTNSTGFRGSEPPMNLNFLGSQQQMSGQQPGMLHSFPWQQSGMNDAQLLQQQQIILKQMQAMQRQPHVQQLEAMQRNAVSQMSAFPSQMPGQHSPAINSNRLNDASNNPWPSHVVSGNTNWPQRGPSSAMPGYSNGLMITPEHGQPMHFMGLIPQQASQSLYGVPVSNSRTINSYSHSNTDKPGGFQVPALDSSSPGNHYPPPVGSTSMQDGISITRRGTEGKSSFELASSQGLGNAVNTRSFNQVQQKNVPISEGGRQDSAGRSELDPEKSVTQPASSQAAAALDPTEEKFLYGNEGSLWDAFGEPSLSETGGTDRLDGTDPLNGFSSLQSGTWSALMQSAVAETTNSDAGMHVEWNGLSSQNSQLQSGYQMPPVLDNGKQQPVWIDSSQRASLGSQNATNDMRTTDYLNASGLPPPFPNRTESQILPEGRKWLDHKQLKPHCEQNRILEDADSSRDFSKTDIGFQGRQQSTFLPHNSDQASSRPNALNFMESEPENSGVASNNQHKFDANVRYRDMFVDAGHDAAMRFESVSNSNVNMGSPHVNRMDDASSPGLRNMKVNRESGQDFLDNHHLDLWKPVNSSQNCGTDNLVIHQRNLNDGPPILESSATTSDGGAVGLHGRENGDTRDNLSDSHGSTKPHHTPPDLRDNVWLDAVDPPSLPGGKEKASSQSSKGKPVSRKFQYHPMDDVGVDLESSYAAKQALHSHPMSQHLSSVVKGHETQPRFLGSSSTKSIDMEKACVSSPQGAVKMSHGVASTGYFPNSSGPSVGSGEVSSSNHHVSPSQKMLELLHKVDQSKDQNIASHLSSSDCNRLSDIAIHRPVGLSQSQSSTAHGFSLQLAPPSQGVGSSNLHAVSQSSSRPVESPSSGHFASDVGDKAHAWLGPVSSARLLPPSCPGLQMQSVNNTPDVFGPMDADGSLQNLKGKLSEPSKSGSPYTSNLLQNQHTPAAGGNAAVSLDRHALHDHQNIDSQDQTAVTNLPHNPSFGKNVNHSGFGASMHQIPAIPTANMSGLIRKDNLSPLGANLWTSQHKLLGAQDCAGDLLKSQFPSNDTLETSSLPQLTKNEQDGPRKLDSASSLGTVDRDRPSVLEAQSVEQTGASQEELIVRRSSDASPSNSSANQKDGEQFHDTVNVKNAANSSYSWQHQKQSMKSTAMTDPSHRESKRFKKPDGDADTQQFTGEAAQSFTSGVNNAVRDPLVSQASVSAGDANILSFSPQPGNIIAPFHMQHGSVASQDVLSFSRNDPQKLTSGNLVSRIRLSGISPQMAPSWFEQYGTLKNGQILPVQNVPRVLVNKNLEHQFISGKSLNEMVVHDSVQAPNPAADTGQISDTCQTMSAYIPSEQIASLDGLVPHVSSPSLSSLRPKKRKTATSDLLPWNIEIGQGIKRLQNVSLAEVDWAQSSNRLVEKVEDETDTSADLLPMIRRKRRLISTAQLMQQVFRSPSASVLSVDATSDCDVIVYSLARLTFGDACSLICCMGGDPPALPECENPISKDRPSERIRDQYFSKVVEDFSNRVKMLENDLLSLDKYASILDVKLDCQDLERFSIINRFARYHGRGQVDGAENSSSSDVNVMAQKSFPQRYVSAHPMPRTVPDRVQCLSL